jgi:phospholipid/cholesterol/gamma-HCH transport system permease protein
MPASLHASTDAGVLTLRVEGRLDATMTGTVWREAVGAAGEAAGKVVLDVGGVAYCDLVGIGLLVELRRRCGERLEIRGLSAEAQKLFDRFQAADFGPALRSEVDYPFVEDVGRATFKLWDNIHAMISYVGELTLALASAVRHPGRVRWKDAAAAAEQAGVYALPIIAMIGFLIGLIMAFQAAISLRPFGAELYVTNLVAISLVRELGPLMTAIVLAGRSGAAFAAEIGTMKVNEEVNALTTMGLSPVRFLVVPRVIAATLVTPVLTVFTIVAGLVGGGLVVMSVGFPLVTYLTQLESSMTATDVVGGLAKSFVFGVLVAAVGCLRGLQTKTGASAVGRSATRAVVSGLVLIILADGVFSVLYYILGI